ncbi:MAG TPA: phosphotransferase [Thermoflexales bacterium]|nr:phosphotransferase [Thermoflexales bacterium]
MASASAGIVVSALILAACGAAATPTGAPAAPSSAAEKTSATATAAPAATSVPASAIGAPPTAAPKPTDAPKPAASPISPPTLPTAPPQIEPRMVELEWTPLMRMGNSDSVRLSLMPGPDGYVAKAETQDGKLVTQVVALQRPDGMSISGVASLTGINFDISPDGAQARDLPAGQPVVWRWSIAPHGAGQHKLVLTLNIRQTPTQPSAGAAKEFTAFSRSLDVRVEDVLGMSAPVAGLVGVMGLLAGGGLSAFALFKRAPRTPSASKAAPASVEARPNMSLQLDRPPALALAAKDEILLRAVFRNYSRAMLESEFRSGYSGARTFLALPIRADGRADAYAIAKIGPRKAIEREYANYEEFVKNTLPPVTARIQDTPVTARENPRDAALRYSFVGMPDAQPISLRRALLDTGDPAYVHKLFNTFGPNWWMQRKPWAFRLAQEYDRMLPAHLVVQSMGQSAGETHRFNGKTPPQECAAYIGDLVTLGEFAQTEERPDGRSLSLTGSSSDGQPALRVRWLSEVFRPGMIGRVVATRETLLREAVKGLELFGLPDPLLVLPRLLDETVRGTESTIHGDLNLENALVGPGGLVWLIDFANTRLGHPLADFAHMQADILAHIVAPQNTSAQAVFGLLRNGSANPLLAAVDEIAARCLFNPSDAREYRLAQIMAYVGALKYENMNAHQRHVLYLMAARVVKELDG